LPVNRAVPVVLPSSAQSLDHFHEALGIVPLVHLPVAQGQKVLVVGKDALYAGGLALRYPTTAEVMIVDAELGKPSPTADKRVHWVARMEDLPADWKADFVAVAVPALTDSLVDAVRRRHLAETGVGVFAISRPGAVRAAKDTLRRFWTTVQPYREHVPPAMDPSGSMWFMLVSDHAFSRQRPVPAWTKRISDKYLPALFTLSKDEYALAYGGAA
jgi:hypothetical protein